MAYRTEHFETRGFTSTTISKDKHFFRKHGENAYYGQRGISRIILLYYKCNNALEKGFCSLQQKPFSIPEKYKEIKNDWLIK